MARLNPDKLHIRFEGGTTPAAPLIPRVYTLTHSDRTGDLFLTIAPDVDHDALNSWQTRLMRDEVLANWRQDSAGAFGLHLLCHVNGGWLNFGPAGWRTGIFRHHMPLVLQALRCGDNSLYGAFPKLDSAPIFVHFRARQERYNKVESWKTPADYRI
jgi:hypothetical protein